MSDRIVMDDIVAGLKGIVYADSRFIYRVVGRKDKSYVLLTFDKENLEVSYLERPLHVFEGDRRATEEEKMTLCKALMRAGQGEYSKKKREEMAHHSLDPDHLIQEIIQEECIE